MRQILGCLLACAVLRVYWTECHVSPFGKVSKGLMVYSGDLVAGSNAGGLYVRLDNGDIKVVQYTCIFESRWSQK